MTRFLVWPWSEWSDRLRRPCRKRNLERKVYKRKDVVAAGPGGVLPYQEVEWGKGGGLGPGIEFRGKIWGKVQSISPNKRKNLGSSITTRRKNWKRITILGAFGAISGIKRAKLGYLSPIFLEAKFGALTWISEAKFGASLYRSTPLGLLETNLWEKGCCSC